MLITLLIGLLIGAILGLTGAGGSIFAVPMLVLLLGLPTSEAVGLSLGSVAASALLGVILRRHSGDILWRPGLVFALTGMLLAPAGKWLGNQLPEISLVIGFALLACLIALRMWRQALHSPMATHAVRGLTNASQQMPWIPCRMSPNGQFQLRWRCCAWLLAGGCITGILSGLFGVGGGFIIVPILLRLLEIGPHKAVGTSLLVISLISSAGFGSHLYFSQDVPLELLALLAGGAILGIIIGSHFAQHLAGPNLQKTFAIGLGMMSLAMVLFR